jgi:histidine triad (HIT) family protein
MSDSVFSRIIRREIPADIVYEDDLVICIKDINPKAPVHLLLIPKKPIVSLAHLTEEDAALMGHLTCQIPKIAAAAGLDNGFRVIVNTGRDGGQEVDHLHYHILGGRKFGFA